MRQVWTIALGIVLGFVLLAVLAFVIVFVSTPHGGDDECARENADRRERGLELIDCG